MTCTLSAICIATHAGLVGLPFGLLLVMVCGAELFTGNIALVATAVSFIPHLPACLLLHTCFDGILPM